MKFFDLKLSYISKNDRMYQSIINVKTDEHMQKNYILAPILKAIKDGN